MEAFVFNRNILTLEIGDNVFDITVRFGGAVYNIESYGFQRVELD